MRKKLLHTVVIVGALSNAVILAMMDMPIWLIVLMSVIYVVIFEGLLLVLEPRLVRAERERNVKVYPFLHELVDAKKATVTLRDGQPFTIQLLKAMPIQRTRKRFYYIRRPLKQRRRQQQLQNMKLNLLTLSLLKSFNKSKMRHFAKKHAKCLFYLQSFTFN